jgi:hypothetical protein
MKDVEFGVKIFFEIILMALMLVYYLYRLLIQIYFLT